MNDFRILLRDEFARRNRKNAAYSLRAFARDLSVSPAFLTLLFSGKKGLSEERARLMADRLGWDRARKSIFVSLVRYGTAKSAESKADILEGISRIKGRDTRFARIQLDTFKAISDWYHYAILELTAIPGFTLTPLNAAAELGIDRKTAADAVARLKRLGILRKSGGRLRKAEENYATFDVPSEAVRSFHRQMIQKAYDAVERQAPEERDLSGITMTIDPELIPKARSLIRDFSNELMELMESGNRREVYQFSTQLFRLSKGKP